jgi:hypothetical protein
MLYLKGASKLNINLVFRPVAYRQNEATVPYLLLHLGHLADAFIQSDLQ